MNFRCAETEFYYHGYISPVEYNGIGWSLRQVAKYPNFLPLCVMSEHGVDLHDLFLPYEIKPRFFFFFIWNHYKYERKQRLFAFRIRLAFPPLYVVPRLVLKLRATPRKSGGVYFAPHSIFEEDFKYNLNTLEAHFLERAFAKLDEPESVAAICLAWEDFCKVKENHIDLGSFEVITAGPRNSSRFIENLTRIILTYDYVCTTSWGSFFAISIFLRRPTYYLDSDLRIVNCKSDLVPLGDCTYLNRRHSIHESLAKKLFDPALNSVLSHDEANPLRRQFLELFAGYPSKKDKTKIIFFLWLSLLVNFDKVLLFFWRRYRNRKSSLLI